MPDSPVSTTDAAHAEWEDLIALSALAGLPPQEQSALQAHLGDCNECRKQLAAYRRVTTSLNGAVPIVEPPAHLETELRRRLRAEKPARVIRPLWWQIAAVAALLVAAVLGARVQILTNELARARSEQAVLLDTMASPDAHPLPAIHTDTRETVGYFVWAPGVRTGTLSVQELPINSSQWGYQLWLIRDDGTVDNGGMIVLDEDGHGYLQVNAQVPWSEYDQFAITEEPASGSTAPTTPILVAGNF